MRSTAAILFTVVLAMFISPLRLPAASCILSNAPSREACKSKCCANMTCCAVSQKNTGPVSQPLLQDGAVKQLVVGVFAAPAIRSHVQLYAADPVAYASVPVRAYSPPPLAATCIRLI
ncbi:MAG TPA: hypothetical protein VK581_01100 [Chthoniobacterales bacterium]|nr:hypothetical protein [Chthoniobacterales bacterium]